MPRASSGGNRVGVCLGVDPGRSGGLAAIHPRGKVEAMSLNTSLHQIWGLVRKYGRGEVSNPSLVYPVFAYLEKVGGYVGGDHARGSHMFQFGHAAGAVEMALAAAGIPYETVAPQTWQRAFGLKKEKGEKGASWKRRLRDKAQALFPQEKVTLSTADALLIAEYCRRKMGRGE